MSSNTVRAKVLCTDIIVAEVGGHSTLYFSAVYSGDPDSENKAFSDATPSLNVSMTIAPNKPAAQLFEKGQEYYLDFTRVAAVVDPRQTSIVGSSLQVRSVVVRGPQGCGKTTNAEAIARHLNLEKVIDGWGGLTDVPTFGALVLTDLPRSHVTNILEGRRIQTIEFDEVMRSSSVRSAAAPASIDDPGDSNVRDINGAAGNFVARREQTAPDEGAGRNDPDPEAHFGAATLDAGNASCDSGAQDGGSAD